MSYKIIKNKPMPGAGNNPKYPFAKMEVGDCFEVVIEEAGSKTQNTLASVARQYAKTYNPTAKFATRKIDGSVWVWRTA